MTGKPATNSMSQKLTIDTTGQMPHISSPNMIQNEIVQLTAQWWFQSDGGLALAFLPKPWDENLSYYGVGRFQVGCLNHEVLLWESHGCSPCPLSPITKPWMESSKSHKASRSSILAGVKLRPVMIPLALIIKWPFKAIVGLLFRCTIAIARFSSKTAALRGTAKTAERNGNSVN